jgi:hypothetical protein
VKDFRFVRRVKEMFTLCSLFPFHSLFVICYVPLALKSVVTCLPGYGLNLCHSYINASVSCCLLNNEYL